MNTALRHLFFYHQYLSQHLLVKSHLMHTKWLLVSTLVFVRVSVIAVCKTASLEQDACMHTLSLSHTHRVCSNRSQEIKHRKPWDVWMMMMMQPKQLFCLISRSSQTHGNHQVWREKWGTVCHDDALLWRLYYTSFFKVYIKTRRALGTSRRSSPISLLSPHISRVRSWPQITI